MPTPAEDLPLPPPLRALTPTPLPRGAWATPAKPGTVSSAEGDPPPTEPPPEPPPPPPPPPALVAPLALDIGLRFVNTPSWPLATPKYFTLYPLGMPSLPTPTPTPTLPGRLPTSPPTVLGRRCPVWCSEAETRR